MKRLMYGCALVALIASFSGLTGRTFAARGSAKAVNVRVCSSMPLGVPSLHAQSIGVFNGAKLATAQWKKRFKAAGLNLLAPITMDYAKSDGSSYDPDKERSNALNCIGRSDTYGYDGALNSGASLVSEPVLNKAGMAQISPANSGTVLTDPAKRSAQEPSTASGKWKTVTYFRTVTTDALQGPSDAIFLNKTLKAKKYYLVDDKLTYGAGLAAEMDKYASSKLGMTRVGSGHVDPTDASSQASTGDAISSDVVAKNPDAVFCGCDSETVIPLVRDLRAKGYTKPVMGGDAWVTQDMIDKAGSSMKNVYATAFGPGPKAAKPFVNAYKKMFHIDLSTYDATSYDAANILLNCIYKVATSKKLTGSMSAKRYRVTQCVAGVKWNGAIGKTSFDKNGDTTNRIIAVYAVQSNKWAVRYFAPKVNVKPTGS